MKVKAKLKIVEKEMSVTTENDVDVLETLQVTLPPRMAQAINKLAQQGYLGSTPEGVIEHCLRQYIFEALTRFTAETAKEVHCE